MESDIGLRRKLLKDKAAAAEFLTDRQKKFKVKKIWALSKD